MACATRMSACKPAPLQGAAGNGQYDGVRGGWGLCVHGVKGACWWIKKMFVYCCNVCFCAQQGEVPFNKKSELQCFHHNSLLKVVLGGFEPPLREPKTLVLPLHHRTILFFRQKTFWEVLPQICGAKLSIYFNLKQENSVFFFFFSKKQRKILFFAWKSCRADRIFQPWQDRRWSIFDYANTCFCMKNIGAT